MGWGIARRSRRRKNFFQGGPSAVAWPDAKPHNESNPRRGAHQYVVNLPIHLTEKLGDRHMDQANDAPFAPATSPLVPLSWVNRWVRLLREAKSAAKRGATLVNRPLSVAVVGVGTMVALTA